MEFSSSNPSNNKNQAQEEIDKGLLFEFDLEDNTSALTSEYSEEEFSFKPINEGLGFHNESYSSTEKRIPRKSLETNKSKASIESKGINTYELGLDSFYNQDNQSFIDNTSSQVVEKSEQKRVKKTRARNATIPAQIASWCIDFTFISVLTISIVLVGVILTDMHLSLDLLGLFQSQLPLLFLMFSCFYLFYFSFLDLDRSLGKEILGLRLVSIDGSQLNFTKTFMRSFVTLLSIVTLGLPLLINFHGRLSETKIVSR